MEASADIDFSMASAVRTCKVNPKKNRLLLEVIPHLQPKRPLVFSSKIISTQTGPDMCRCAKSKLSAPSWGVRTWNSKRGPEGFTQWTNSPDLNRDYFEEKSNIDIWYIMIYQKCDGFFLKCTSGFKNGVILGIQVSMLVFGGVHKVHPYIDQT